MPTQIASASSADDSGALVVRKKERVAEGVIRLTLEDPGGRRLPPWSPGAHLELFLPNDLVRHYSLCGDRWDGFSYEVAVLRTPDSRGGSQWIHDHLREGMVLPFGGPRNHFPLVPADRYRFIAGGIGITPLIPMIRQAIQVGASWDLLYGGRSRRSMAFYDRLNTLGAPVRLWPQDELGLPDIGGWLGSPVPRTAIYACGPEGLLLAVTEACERWPRYSLRTERFVAADRSQAADRDISVALRSGETLTVTPRETVLDALRRLGKAPLSSCRQGVCGTCEVAVLDGVPDHRDSVLNDMEREAGDCMLVCVSRAKSASLTLDL
ncbi:PDR/VanB family oxidoreductase [Amycolatopsis palatopharyngis]|uniref:PDR/VanB family oxidoreductase n=1 Tax=Amycolatopsis palatopharyngis TaxID=187982 RepID=UPI000E23D34C|nr:PDR/VanB family oxidoreductase [Amycolatopsis palatopharyngis]